MIALIGADGAQSAWPKTDGATLQEKGNEPRTAEASGAAARVVAGGDAAAVAARGRQRECSVML